MKVDALGAAAGRHLGGSRCKPVLALVAAALVSGAAVMPWVGRAEAQTPPNSPPQFPSGVATRSVPENTAAGVDIGAALEATDIDGDELTYVVGGVDGSSFDIDASSGQLKTRAALDYEADDNYLVTVSVLDGKDVNGNADLNADDTIDVMVSVVNVDEAGEVSLFPRQLRVGTVVRATLSDPDGAGAVRWVWERSPDQIDWTRIRAGDQDSHTPADADDGMHIRVRASYSDGEGGNKAAQAQSVGVVGDRAPGPELVVEEIVTGLTIPWDIAFVPDGTMLFTQRRGVLSSRLSDGTVQVVAADLSDLFAHNEAGLMAIIADPAFASSRQFYTCQAHTGITVQVIAWTIDDAYTAAERAADPLVGGIPAAGRHSGCRLRFGPQGHLWVSTGDAAVGTHPQDRSSLGGKVLRVDASTGGAAPSNPFPGSLIYSFGHRNVQGLALRPGTAQMWAVEHGPSIDDEINLLSAGGNYGWDPVPGYNDGVPMTDRVKFPAAVEAKWSSGNPTLATSGGIFIQGEQWGPWEGRLAVAALVTKSLRIFDFAADGTFVSQVVVPELDGAYGRLRTPMTGPDGALYVTTSNGSGDDKILRVAPANLGLRFPSSETGERGVRENTPAGLPVGDPFEATDEEGDPLTYSLDSVGGAVFDIDETTGQLRTRAPLDRENKDTYRFTVSVSDGRARGGSADAAVDDTVEVTVAVTDENEPPQLTGPSDITVRAARQRHHLVLGQLPLPACRRDRASPGHLVCGSERRLLPQLRGVGQRRHRVLGE